MSKVLEVLPRDMSNYKTYYIFHAIASSCRFIELAKIQDSFKPTLCLPGDLKISMAGYQQFANER